MILFIIRSRLKIQFNWFGVCLIAILQDNSYAQWACEKERAD